MLRYPVDLSQEGVDALAHAIGSTYQPVDVLLLPYDVLVKPVDVLVECVDVLVEHVNGLLEHVDGVQDSRPRAFETRRPTLMM